MTTAKNLALSVSLASYAKDYSAPAVVTISNQKLVKVERPKAVKGKRAPAPTAVQVDKPTTPSPNAAMAVAKLPPAGTLGAKGFIMMMNRAKSRDEKIVAIASYVGYDVAGDFATQEMAASAKAKGEIRPVQATGPSREETKTAQRSAKGYVAGMPDNQRKLVQDLLGRENLAVSTRNDLVRDARNHERSMTDRKLSIGLARLELERLIQIRADLARYV